MRAKDKKRLKGIISLLLILSCSTFIFYISTSRARGYTEGEPEDETWYWIGEEGALYTTDPKNDPLANKIYEGGTQTGEDHDLEYYIEQWSAVLVSYWNDKAGHDPPDYIVNHFKDNLGYSEDELEDVYIIPYGKSEDFRLPLDHKTKIDAVVDAISNIPTIIFNMLMKIPETIVNLITGVFNYLEGGVYDIRDYIKMKLPPQATFIAMPTAMVMVGMGIFLLIEAFIKLLEAIPII